MRIHKYEFKKTGKMETIAVFFQSMILILLLFSAMVRPIKILKIGYDDFVEASFSNVEYDGTVISIRDKPAQSFGMYGYALDSGAYEVKVQYRSEPEEKENNQTATGAIQLESAWPIRVTDIELKNNQTTAESRLWIPISADCRDLSVMCWYRGNGFFEWGGVTFTESRAYRYVRILGIALLFLLVDAVYVFFFSSRTLMTQRKKVFLVLTGLIFIASLPVLTNFLFDGHDLSFHLKRIAILAEEIKYGQIPVRMMTTATNNYGYPLPIFYCDFFLYIVAMFYNCMVPLQNCYHLYIILINAATTVIAYYCFYRITRQRKMSLLCTALYVLCSSRLNHLTVRAAVGEYTAMVFLPLILLGMYEIYCSEKPCIKEWFPLFAGMSGVLMSHVLTTELILFDLILLCMMLPFKMFRRNRLKAIMKAAGMCSLLCMWFVVPFIDYYLNHSIKIQDTIINIQERGIYLIQLLGVFLTGSGWSNYMNSMKGAMPLTIGFSLTVGIVAVLVCFINRSKWKIQQEKYVSIWYVFFIIAAINIVMSLQYFPWTMIQMHLRSINEKLEAFVCTIQFPWRWLTSASVLLVFCVLFALITIQKRDEKLYRMVCSVLLAALTISTGCLYHQYSNQVSSLQRYVEQRDAYLDDLYLLDGTQKETYIDSGISVIEGKVEIGSYYKEEGVSYLKAENTTDVPALVSIPVFAYRHYHAFDENGNEFSILSDAENRILLEIPPYSSPELEIRFIPPFYWRIAEMVSLSTMFALCASGGWILMKNKNREKTLSQFS